jgi:uncharacterized protein YdeI (YjbR/CyaY-like superfamily)
MTTLNPKVDAYLIDGCGRCKYYATPQCKVHTWVHILQELRQLALESDLVEEYKWSQPVYTYNDKNVIIVTAFKEYCCISFLKGVLLKDEAKLLVKQGENQQSGRLLKFTNIKEVTKNKKIIKAYIKEAIEIEKSGGKVTFEKNPEPMPEELINKLNELPSLKNAFYSLTPGKQRSHIIYISQPKSSKSRADRVDKCIEKIMRGEGFHDAYKKENPNK